MFLYLVQHAEAKREKEDPARPLSQKGVEEVKKVVSFISGLHMELEEVFHSGKLRAKQTAEVLAGNINITKGLSEINGLSPLDDPAIWVEKLKSHTNPLMIVGHLPHLGKLVSLLLCGGIEKNCYIQDGWYCLS